MVLTQLSTRYKENENFMMTSIRLVKKGTLVYCDPFQKTSTLVSLSCVILPARNLRSDT